MMRKKDESAPSVELGVDLAYSQNTDYEFDFTTNAEAPAAAAATGTAASPASENARTNITARRTLGKSPVNYNPKLMGPQTVEKKPMLRKRESATTKSPSAVVNNTNDATSKTSSNNENNSDAVSNKTVAVSNSSRSSSINSRNRSSASNKSNAVVTASKNSSSIAPKTAQQLAYNNTMLPESITNEDMLIRKEEERIVAELQQLGSVPTSDLGKTVNSITSRGHSRTNIGIMPMVKQTISKSYSSEKGLDGKPSLPIARANISEKNAWLNAEAATLITTVTDILNNDGQHPRTNNTSSFNNITNANGSSDGASMAIPMSASDERYGGFNVLSENSGMTKELEKQISSIQKIKIPKSLMYNEEMYSESLRTLNDLQFPQIDTDLLTARIMSDKGYNAQDSVESDDQFSDVVESKTPTVKTEITRIISFAHTLSDEVNKVEIALKNVVDGTFSPLLKQNAEKIIRITGALAPIEVDVAELKESFKPLTEDIRIATEKIAKINEVIDQNDAQRNDAFLKKNGITQQLQAQRELNTQLKEENEHLDEEIRKVSEERQLLASIHKNAKFDGQDKGDWSDLKINILTEEVGKASRILEALTAEVKYAAKKVVELKNVVVLGDLEA